MEKLLTESIFLLARNDVWGFPGDPWGAKSGTYLVMAFVAPDTPCVIVCA